MEKILIVTVNWLGDAIMTTPVPEAIKIQYPQAYIAILAPKRVAGVFENNPYVDEVISFDDIAFKKSLVEKLALVNMLRPKKFNIAFLIHRSFSRALICWAAGIKHRIGYRRFKTFFILTKRISPPLKIVHRQDYYLYLFEKIGIHIANRHTRFYVSDKSMEKMNHFLIPIRRNYKYFVGINPSANWALKRWPVMNFAYLADKLIAELNCAIFFIGAEKDNYLVEDIIKRMSHDVYNMCGKTNLDELAALIKNFNVFLSNDSGPAHLSAALNIPTVILFGPTASQLTAPRGKQVRIIHGITSKKAECRIPCYNLNCKNNVCMQSIDKNEVFDAIKKIIT